MDTAYVYAACDIAYASFYIHGLQELLGKSRVKYSFKKFPIFYQGTLAIIIESAQYGTRKIGIDFYDRQEFIPDLLEWCDVYGKININKDFLPDKHMEKLVAIGPGFGIRLYNWHSFAIMAFLNYFKAAAGIPFKKKYFSCYLSQYKHRLPLSVYKRRESNIGFLFFLSSIWKKEQQTNTFRANFIEEAKNLNGVAFEGGFAPRKSNDVPGFEQITVAEKYDLSDYLEKMSRSFTAFNTPAVLGCHGWKLGEFLLLGKAIISTPITRELPAPLIHGEHIHIIDGGKEDIRQALQLLHQDKAYRAKLEKNAYNYYQQYVCPKIVLQKLLQQA